MDFWGDDRPGNWVKITPENHKGPALLVRAGEYLPLPRAKGMYRFKVEGNCQITFWLHRLDDNVPPGGVPTSPTPRTPLPQPKLASHI